MESRLTKATSTLIALAILGIFLDCVRSDPTFGAPNVCNKTISVRKDLSVDEPVKYEIKYDAICGIFPCTKTRVITRMDSKIKTTLEDMKVAVCCPGYAESPDKQCLPICLKSCNNGKCVRPNVCECQPPPTETSPGFVGSTCSMFSCLSTDRWGAKCERECKCPINSYCSASTGKCLCHPGWRGLNCSEECDSNSDCGDIELPPIIEPDANMMNEIMGASMKLEALSSNALNREIDDEASYRMSYSTIGIQLFLIASIFVLVLSIFRYRQRLDKLRAELYYGPTTSSSPSSSNYSPNSLYSTGTSTINPQNRPRMPIPTENEFLGKNLSFAAATRNILSTGNTSDSKNKVEREKILVDQKLESHLMNSQQNSQQNIYSDIDSNFSERSYKIQQPNPISTPSDGRLLNICIIPEENNYQVPRSPAIKTAEEMQLSRQNLLDVDESSDDIYINNDQIYEEIKPRSSLDSPRK